LSYSAIWWSELNRTNLSAFQTRANPSQYPTERKARDFLRPPPLLVVHLSITARFIVYVHEEVLAPLSSCFCIVTKHTRSKLHTQCRLRSQQRHACFFRRGLLFLVVALDAGVTMFTGELSPPANAARM